MRKTIEHERANFCIEKVKEVTSDKKKYKSNARSLPSFIISNGLIPTLAFYKSKEEKNLFMIPLMNGSKREVLLKTMPLKNL